MSPPGFVKLQRVADSMLRGPEEQMCNNIGDYIQYIHVYIQIDIICI
jgi:hypothetical protein